MNDDSTARRRSKPPKEFLIPKGFVGDFESLFKEFRSPSPSPFDVVSVDDGVYSGKHRIPYIVAPSHLTFGNPVKKRSDRPQQQVMASQGSSPVITIFTQTSIDRMNMLPDLVERWDGHVSVAVYVETYADLPTLSTELRNLQYRFIEMGDGKYVSVSLLFGLEFLISMGFDYDESVKDAPMGGLEPRMFDGEEGEEEFRRDSRRRYRRRSSDASSRRRKFHPYDFLFPINSLRNLALSQSITDHVLSLDVDFITSFRAHSILTSPHHLNLLLNNTVIVLPAFEFSEDSFQTRKPLPILTMDHLRSACLTSTIVPFHAKSTARTRGGEKGFCEGLEPPTHLTVTPNQAATNYVEFMKPNHAQAYPALLPVNKGHRAPLDRKFEPYVLARRSVLPEFDETFRGYGFNKRQQSIMLQAMGVRFFVARNVFVVHRPHEASKGRVGLKGLVKATVGRAYRRFLGEIRRDFFGKKVGKGGY
ncbi:hypothetical protein HDU67_002646 [Dinochytrium kinnereticum]|nr:hypothetical protein HDU67_002646 [Dinochytrium kinnereticum]